MTIVTVAEAPLAMLPSCARNGVALTTPWLAVAERVVAGCGSGAIVGR
jgi:hypothetical protein